MNDIIFNDGLNKVVFTESGRVYCILSDGCEVEAGILPFGVYKVMSGAIKNETLESAPS